MNDRDADSVRFQGRKINITMLMVDIDVILLSMTVL